MVTHHVHSAMCSRQNYGFALIKDRTINEETYLSSFPGKKSFTMELTLSTEDEKVSPMIDLDRVNLITISNRINNW